ncbi:hypothetical protein LIA77_04737 [Sarocladium implicatum]|nr:hypothetical protein LIA77_04737 [Sarocladium implicatum]
MACRLAAWLNLAPPELGFNSVVHRCSAFNSDQSAVAMLCPLSNDSIEGSSLTQLARLDPKYHPVLHVSSCNNVGAAKDSGTSLGIDQLGRPPRSDMTTGSVAP